MSYKFLIKDLNSQKKIGTDKGLAKIGDGIVNLTYSIAKSIYLTENSSTILRTGIKVNKTILSNALKNANMKNFAKNRADAHDLANTAEAIIAYVFLKNKMTLNEIIDFLKDNLTGNIENRTQETKYASIAFTNLLIHTKKFLPEE